MIRGIGVDIVQNVRIAKSLAKKGFAEKVFSKEEIAYCQNKKNPTENFAGRFAAKEALVKALGELYYFKFAPNEVEVLNDEKGKPEFNLKREFLEQYNLWETAEIHLSISHTTEHAVAMVIIEMK